MHKQQFPSKEYFSDHYGICELKNCKCLLEHKNLTTCNHWTSFDINSHNDLINNAKNIRNTIEGYDWKDNSSK